MSNRSPYLAMVAGEASGDRIGASLIQTLSEGKRLSLSYTGIGGQEMIHAGLLSLVPFELLSVNGYVEALKRIPAIIEARSRLMEHLCLNKPLAFVGIDAPDFNLPIARRIRRLGVPTIQYVSPSIWAWRAHRIEEIRQSVDRVLCLFPFEVELYEQAGVNAVYVGHPLADMLPLCPDMGCARAALKLPETGDIVAVLPGSKSSEISNLGPVFFSAMRLLHKLRPSLRFVLPIASCDLQGKIAFLCGRYPELPLTLVQGNSHTVIEAANVVMTSNGTATLEAALLKKPMVIAYKFPRLMESMVSTQRTDSPFIGVPNILTNQYAVPELIQSNANEENLAKEVIYQLTDDENREKLRQLFTSLHFALKRNAEHIAANSILEML